VDVVNPVDVCPVAAPAIDHYPDVRLGCRDPAGNPTALLSQPYDAEEVRSEWAPNLVDRAARAAKELQIKVVPH
jgi:hypothetical protein